MAANSRFAVATHIMVVIAHHKDYGPPGRHKSGGLVEAGFIAGSVNTNSVVVRRMIGELTRAGLLITHTGRGGGVELARPASRITLLDILEAIGEMELFSYNVNPANPLCPISSKMTDVLTPIFESNQDAIKKSLRKVKLSALVKQIGVS